MSNNLTFNVIISGNSVSGNLDTKSFPLTIDLGNSDRIGKATFALQNKDSTYSATLFSGNATFQIDAMQGNTVLLTVFRGTLEQANQRMDTTGGMRTEFTGYDLGQELLGLVSPDARQPSLVSGGIISLTSGDQGMGVLTGMDLVLYVSGAIGSGTVGYPVGGFTLGKPLAVSVASFMSQYFGKSGDTTGTNSGQAFSFKPYFSGIAIWSGNEFYKTWYAQDGGASGLLSDTNSNYWLTYDSLKAKHEVAWDVLKKITRQSYVIDRSGTKTQFELHIGVSGDIHLRTSGTSDFLSNATLVYYQAGQSGAANNNVEEFHMLPWDTTQLKNYIVGWFPTWTQYPFGDDYSDVLAYSGAMWSGGNSNAPSGIVSALSGNSPAPGVPGFISIMGNLISGRTLARGGFELMFTLWSGTSLNIQRWNVSGGNGVALGYSAQGSTNLASFDAASAPIVSNRLIDTSGNFIILSGDATGLTAVSKQAVLQSGWMSLSRTIYTASGTFLSGDGNTGWAFGSISGVSGAIASGLPDLTRVKQIGFGFGTLTDGAGADTYTFLVDDINFDFVFNYNPVIIFSSGSISTYGRRYEVFEFPYQYTDSGAAGVVTAELYGKMFSRGLAEILVKDNPNQSGSVQLSITPGQAFVLDAPSLAAGSGQFYFYFVATQITHKWDVNRGFLTTIRAYPFFSGATTLSGQNLVTYSMTTPMQVQPQTAALMPNTHWWGPFIGAGV